MSSSDRHQKSSGSHALFGSLTLPKPRWAKPRARCNDAENKGVERETGPAVRTCVMCACARFVSPDREGIIHLENRGSHGRANVVLRPSCARNQCTVINKASTSSLALASARPSYFILPFGTAFFGCVLFFSFFFLFLFLFCFVLFLVVVV